jgi:nucleoside-diphosphate-sugar epimerase
MSFKVLVPGGAGYIGSTLVPELLNRGYEVTVYDNFMYKQNSLSHVCYHPKFSVINGDIRDYKKLEPHIKKADVIIPLAALVGAPICSKDPTAASTVNKDAHINLFRSVSKDQWVLMPTTNSAYGTGEAGNYCTEESPLKPISLYAIDKVEVEKELMQNPNAVSFRLATVFGMSPKMRIDLLVNDFAYRAVYDKFVVLFEAHFKRNYVHVRDVCSAFMHGIDNFEKMRGQVYNVGLSDANLSKMELCTAIKKHLPDFTIMEAAVGKDPDQRNYIVSNDKIEKTGFKPKVSLDDGIRELIKGYTMIKNSLYGNV